MSNVRQTSLQAYQELRDSDLGERQLKVLNGFRKFGDATAREMQVRLGFHEGNMIKPRITELKKAGYLIEFPKRKCSITGKNVLVFGVNTHG
jgi:hypothetical protein